MPIKCKLCNVIKVTEKAFLDHLRKIHPDEFEGIQVQGIDSIQTFGLMVRPSDL